MAKKSLVRKRGSVLDEQTYIRMSPELKKTLRRQQIIEGRSSLANMIEWACAQYLKENA